MPIVTTAEATPEDIGDHQCTYMPPGLPHPYSPETCELDDVEHELETHSHETSGEQREQNRAVLHEKEPDRFARRRVTASKRAGKGK